MTNILYNKNRNGFLAISIFILSSFINLDLAAQNFYFEDTAIDTVFLENNANLNSFGYAKVYLTFVNDIDSTTTFQWIKHEIDLPDGWTVSVCDANYCYLPEVLNAITNVNANSNYEFAFQFNPYIQVGTNDFEIATGTANIKFDIAADQETTETVDITVSIDNLVNNSYILNKTIKVYPNPTSNLLKIDGDFQYNYAKVFDLDGVFLKAFYDTNLNIEDLPKGKYILNFYGNKNQLLGNKRIVKQ